MNKKIDRKDFIKKISTAGIAVAASGIGLGLTSSKKSDIKKSLKDKINLNKLNTKQIIQFTLDKTNNKIKELS